MPECIFLFDFHSSKCESFKAKACLVLSFIRSDNQRRLYLYFFDSLLAVLNSTSERKSFAMASLLGVREVKRNVERLG